MAWVRCCGGGTKKSLLSPLNSLAESFTRWVKNTYLVGVGGAGSFNSNYGSISISANIATIGNDSGYSVGFVTNCESTKSYAFTYNFDTSDHNVANSVRIQYYNGTTLISYLDLTGEGTNLSRAFTVPSGCDTVVINPRMSNNGTITFSYTSLVEA